MCVLILLLFPGYTHVWMFINWLKSKHTLGIKFHSHIRQKFNESSRFDEIFEIISHNCWLSFQNFGYCPTQFVLINKSNTRRKNTLREKNKLSPIKDNIWNCDRLNALNNNRNNIINNNCVVHRCVYIVILQTPDRDIEILLLNFILFCDLILLLLLLLLLVYK